MSTVGDVFDALRRIVLIDSEINQLRSKLDALNADVDGLTNAVGMLRDRVSRLEGFIEGAAAASQSRPSLPSQ